MGEALPKKTSQSFVKLCFGHCSKLITKQKAPVCPLGYQAIMNINFEKPKLNSFVWAPINEILVAVSVSKNADRVLKSQR